MPRLCTRLALRAALTLWALGLACDGDDAGSPIDQARAAYQQGHLNEARELFEQALAEAPGDVGALVGLIDIHLDRGEIEQAATRFQAIDGLELDRRGEQLCERVRLRYYGMLYEQARGDGPGSPRDPDTYESALIALFNLEAEPEHNGELAELFAIQARRALGAADPTQPLEPSSPALEDASLAQLQAALDGYRRFTERDPRLTRVLHPSESIAHEAAAIVPALEHRIFDRQFDARFEAELRPTLIEEGRFDAERNAIVVQLTSPEPYPGERPEGEALDALRQEMAVALVVEELTDLAYRMRGTERTTDQPIQLGRTPEEVDRAYDGIEVVSFEIARSGIITMEVRAPYELLPRTAWRLEQYLAWLATRTAAEGTGEGSGAGRLESP